MYTGTHTHTHTYTYTLTHSHIHIGGIIEKKTKRIPELMLLETSIPIDQEHTEHRQNSGCTEADILSIRNFPLLPFCALNSPQLQRCYNM